MFTWHEATRRRVCRSAFLALVAVPTCAVLSAAAWIRTPAALTWQRRALAEQLSLDVTLAEVRLARPQVGEYQGLSLSDPETGKLLARLRSVEANASGPQTLIACPQTEVDGTRLARLWELAGRSLRRHIDLKQPVHIFTPQLTLYTAGGLQQLECVRGRFEEGPAGPQGVMVFRLIGAPPAAEVRVAFRRNRQAGSASTLVQIETGEVLLPCELLAAFLPRWDVLGANAAFCGRLWWHDRADGAAGEISGQFTGVDLDSVLRTQFARTLSGTATINLERAVVRQGRLVEAQGTILTGPGQISRNLLAAASLHTHAPLSMPPAAQGQLVAYEQLGWTFTLDGEGLTIEGSCTRAEAGTLLLGPSGPILKQPPLGPQSPLNLVRALAAAGDELVPASAAAQALVRLLPVPVTARAKAAGNTVER
jgi:hypothetical protein